MRGQSIRLFVYSSLAIVVLGAAWGFREIPKQGQMAHEQLQNSLEQEQILLNGAVKSSVATLKLRLLEVLRTEGAEANGKSLRDSIFTATTLVEWDRSEWKVLGHHTLIQDELSLEKMKSLMNQLPLARLASDEVHFAKVGDVQGQAYFAMAMPVRRTVGATQMIGVGVFPATQFGLQLAAGRSRSIKVFDSSGFALALTQPMYLGASIRRDPLVYEILSDEVVTLRQQWKSANGEAMLGVAGRVPGSNLSASIETHDRLPNGWKLRAWLYLVLCCAGAVALNWALFAALVSPLLKQLEQTDSTLEEMRKMAINGIRAPAVINEIDEIGGPAMPGADAAAAAGAPAPVSANLTPTVVVPAQATLGKVVNLALRSLDASIQKAGVSINKIGLEQVPLDHDLLQLQTAIEELIKNSLEAMEGCDQRQITIEGAIRNSRILLRIEDTGSGVEESALRKIFEPFFTTKEAKGMSRGLGLSVVRRVMEEMKGTATAHRAANGGLVVELELPLLSAVADTTVANASLPDASPTKKSLTTNELNFLEDELEDDFTSMSLGLGSDLKPESPIRRPRVRSLE